MHAPRLYARLSDEALVTQTMMLMDNSNTRTLSAQGVEAPRPLASFKRRANSCKPCRDSKSRCSGGMPCTTCQRKRDKPECFYVAFPVRMGRNQPRQAHGSRQSVEQGALNFCGIFSLSRSVDEFKLLLPTKGRFREIIDCIRPIQAFSLNGHAADIEPVIDLARLNQSTSDSDFQFPSNLRPLYMKYKSVRDLLVAGRAMRAWAAFPSLVRDAEIIGLNVNVSVATAGTDEDLQPGRYLCWLLVELDVQLSFLLGRRPFIAPFHGVATPFSRTWRQEEEGLQQNVFEFSQYMIEVLDRFNSDKNDQQTMFSEARETMLEADLSRLYQLQLKLPPLSHNAWSDAPLCIAVTQHHIDVQLVLMVLHCQTLRSMPNQRKLPREANYRNLLKCTRMITEMFDSIHGLDPTRTASSWPRCFGVFCATVMLGIATIRQEVGVGIGSKRVKRTLEIFRDLAEAGQASGVAQLALESLGLLVERIRELEHSPTIATTATDDVTPPAPPCDLDDKAKEDISGLKRRRRSSLEEELQADKRPKPELNNISPGSSMQRHSTWQHSSDHPFSQATAAFNNSSASNVQNRPRQHGFQQEERLSPAASTSFSADNQRGLSNVGYGFTQLEHFQEFQAAHHWVHPPMMYHPPMYDDWWQAQFASHDAMSSDHTRQMFYGPLSAPPMDQAHHPETAMHGDGHAGFAHLQQEPTTHAETPMVIDSSTVHSLGHMQALTHSPQGPAEGKG
ncbi:uncharacterized protein Z519_10878 [Cladophialophora bantiana CBS 173.52]|uniref:Zn(2)-C6 fungal-type domain-containing protein n=1 Tax=Cladophialophora bantiana (strain ATCC 10958 / CBS 173.52 / CDC B-1940 / NIH 8579) TaxID=1442370 RepID=A0A0D2EDU2_CLAB1|nr:uncharacterized protein Z519_10878 [Cladophialophora bantiana CBS 173.52]KIW88311.1 hypothetical protein Z519_10878 [Cladophialophora bantiana CBS 173.52]